MVGFLSFFSEIIIYTFEEGILAENQFIGSIIGGDFGLLLLSIILLLLLVLSVLFVIRYRRLCSQNKNIFPLLLGKP